MQNDSLRAALEKIAATGTEEPGDAFYSPTDFARAQHYKWELVNIVRDAKAALALQQQEVPREPVADERLLELAHRFELLVNLGEGIYGPLPSGRAKVLRFARAVLAASPSTTEKPVRSEMLRQCAASGQMDSAQIHAHEVAGEMPIPDGVKEVPRG